MIDPDKYSPAARILALKLTGQVGPRTFDMLQTSLKTVGNILLAEQDELEQLPGIGPKRSKAIADAHLNLDRAQDIVDNLEATGINVTTRLDPDYPVLMRELNDPPLMLFYKGNMPPPERKLAAVIGSQNVSNEGIADAVELARMLAQEGIGIVGGLARGIDAAGHTGALKAEGYTCAVLPCGLNTVHPAEHVGLAEQISERGCLLSEYLPDTKVTPGQLLARNRLIVGLANAVIIGEMSKESVGTMDAAECCHQLGKLMFTVIGAHNPHYEKIAGYGAIPLTGIEQYKMVFKALV
jgi:DNA processing protein